MHKGFGFYSAGETAIFLTKSLLLSFWLGLDAIAALVMTAFSLADVMRHALLLVVVLAVLIGGTVFSAFFVWATGSPPRVSGTSGAATAALAALKERPHYLIGACTAAASACLVVAAGGLALLQWKHADTLEIGRADLALAAKCAEVARLEDRLFEANQQFVMAQCLIQYDAKYAALRKDADSQQR